MESEGLAQTDGRGSRSQVVYDAQGRVTKTIDSLGHETTYAYDALGRQTAVTDPLGHTVTTTYDAGATGSDLIATVNYHSSGSL